MSRIYSQEDTNFNDQDSVQVWSYDLPTWSMGLAVAKFNGRHPRSGSSSNIGCEIVYYVISGSGTIYSENGRFEIGPGDVYHFMRGERYYVVGDNLQVVIPSSPTWQPRDHKEYDHL